MESIEDILAGKPTDQPAETPVVEQAAAPEAVVAPEATDNSGINRDPATGKFAPKVAAEATADNPNHISPEQSKPDADSEPSKGWTYAAVKDEKQKRQEAQRRADEAERRANEFQRQLAQIADTQRQQAQPAHELMFSDSEEYQRIQDQKIQEIKLNSNIRASRAENIAIHGLEAVNAVDLALIEAIESGDPEIPALRQRLINSEDPVGVALKWHKESRLKKEVGDDLGAFLERKKAEHFAEFQAANAKPAAVFPSNIAGSRNVGTRQGPAWAGPTPLADIFKYN